MAAPKIAAVATATPPWRYDQATVLRMSGYDDPRRMGFFNNSLIETRHLYFDPETFTPDESVDELNERWRRGAVEVGTAAVARAIERAGWRREDVDFLATTTCTGRVCPSLDAQIINELELKPTIQRVHVGDTGCASAMVAMQQVSNHLRAFPAHRAVMVAVEICSAAYFLDDRLESAVAHAIFADGAGAIAVGADGPGPEIVEHRTMFRPEHLGAMGFEYPGGRPRVVLSKDVRRIGAGMMKEMVDTLLASHGLKQTDIKGLSERQVRRLEEGDTLPHSSTLTKLAASHGMSINDYMGELAKRSGRRASSSGSGSRRTTRTKPAARR
jgi:alkylresorcinol/alkylpyrone synthase